ncbi:MAG: effector-associated domain EAD1-containing protein [Pseudomonadota bacterium]|nr:effector-associated domain EAD1-containing protein [Pseudomonadota bacterium]
MELDDATRDELAGFFARRFPTADARERLARAAGVPPDAQSSAAGSQDARAAWSALLTEARASGALLRLADAACAAAPEDGNLAEACALLRGPPPRRAGLSGVAAGVSLASALVVTALVGGWWIFGGRGEGTPATSPTTTGSSAAVAPAPAPVDPPEAAVPAVASEPVPTEPVPTDVAPVAPSNPPAPEPADPPVAVSPAPAAPAPAATEPPAVASTARAPAPEPFTSASGAPSNCQGATGVVVGWWYAGTTSPGAQGETIGLPSSVNVRDDYPRRENGYALRGRVLCSLSGGTRQRLSQAPVDIGQGHWWVPVAGGDLAP